MKKTLSVILAVIMALSVFAVTAFAAGTPICDFGNMVFDTQGTPVVFIYDNGKVVATWGEGATQTINPAMTIIGSDIKASGAVINAGLDIIVNEAGTAIDGWYLNGVKVTENFADDTIYDAQWYIDNKIEGVYEEYPATRTVTFTAIGEGMDNEEPAEGDVRYCPVFWETDEDKICGEFAKGEYSARYTNRLFGDHTLAVTFEKQVYVEGEWVSVNAEAPVVDVKEVSYYVGPNAEEEKEIIFPMQILKYIYALLSYLVEKIVSLVG